MPREDRVGRVGGWLAAAIVLGAAGAASAEPQRVRLDDETVVNGIGVGCTGIGETKNQPRWQAYPVRLEFADQKSNYLAGEEVTVSNAKGEALLDVTCEGPWVVVKLPPGQSYKAEARLVPPTDEVRSATVKAPPKGQTRFVFTFKGAD
jgi:hypothetical protein